MSQVGISTVESLRAAIECDEILIADKLMSSSAIFARYEVHDLGVYHADQPLRYSQKYAYNRTYMLADLGDDVHPVRHGRYTEQAVVVPILSGQIEAGIIDGLTQSSVGIVRMAAMTHDFGECQHPSLGETIGDIAFYDKTCQHEEKEAEIRGRVMELVYPTLPVDFLLEVEDVVANKSGTQLRDFFNAAEHTGYFLTMSGAGRLALEAITNEDFSLRTIQLARMAIDGARQWHDDILGLSDKFAYLGHLAQQSDELVDRIDSELPIFLDRAQDIL